jgi:AcrR family transcriptional regulator
VPRAGATATSKADQVDPRDRRAQLLEAGARLFGAHPYAEVSAEAIAQEAGVAHGLLFHYFGNKREFFKAVLQQLTEAGPQFDTNSTTDPTLWLRRELDLFLGQARRNELFAATIHGSLGAEQEAQEVVRRQAAAAADRVLARLEAEQETALLRDAVAGWVAFTTEMGAQWSESGARISQRQMRAVLSEALHSALRSVARLDPQARFDPERFSDG